MTRRILTAALALAAVLPTLASAQERQRSRSRDEVRARPRVQVFGFNRARLGVTVQTKADPETDRYGARIVSVLDDGPADEAGLKEGDIITRFNSTTLANARPEDMDDDSDMSGPGLRLVELAQELDEGDTVRIQYRRDGASHDATLVAEEFGNQMSFYRFNDDGPAVVIPKMEELPRFQFRTEPGEMRFFQGPGNFSFFMNGAQGLHLIELNDDLGEYFGTSEGLLVARASSDSSIPLRSGDVILTIDGRKPSSVAHALRIIGSYEDGEKVQVEVMRKRQRANVEWTVDREETRMRSLLPSRRTLERTPRSDRTRM